MRMHEILRLLNETLELNRIGLLILDALLIKSTPSYVSEWKSMTANSNTSRVTLSHDLQEAPAYVKVEARTKNGFTFPAFGSAQQDDDDTRAIYGGVVFVYDSTHIDIFVPHYSNDGASRSKWAAVYTGERLSVFTSVFMLTLISRIK